MSNQVRKGAGVLAGLLISGMLLAGAATAGDEAWTGDINLSVAAGSGTNNTFAGNLDAKTERSWEKDAVGARFSGTYGTTDSRDQKKETTQNQQGIFGDWKRTIHKRFFWGSAAEVSRDNVQDRELRALVTTGPGYRIWQHDDEGKEHFDVTAGFGYRYEIIDGNTGATVADNGDTDHFADAVAGFEYKHLLFDGKIDYTHTADVALPVNDPNAFIVTTEIIASVPVSGAWSLRFGTLVQYTNDVPDEIEKLRTSTTAGIGYKF